MRILNLISYTNDGVCQNIGDLFSALSLRKYLGENLTWQTVFFNEEKVKINPGDCLIIGGGGLYHPAHLEKLNERVDWQKFDQPLALIGLGLNLDRGEKLGQKDKAIVKLIHEKSFLSSCRDWWTLDFLKRLGIKSHLTGCPAVFLPDFFSFSKTKKYDLGINIALYHTPWHQKNSQKIIAFVKNCLLPLKGKKIFLCHSQAEPPLLREIFRAQKFFYSTDPQQVFQAYAQTRMVIGMRSHSQIFALGVGTPSLAIDAGEKVVQPVKMIWSGKSNLIIGLDDDLTQVDKKVEFLKKNAKEVKKKQKKLKEKLKKEFSLVVKKIKARVK